MKVYCDDNKNICDISLPMVEVVGPFPIILRAFEIAKSLPSVIGVDL